MAFKMGFSKDELKGQEPVPSGVYTVQFVGFRPKLAKSKDSINLNAEVKIIGHPDYENRRIFAGLNTKIAAWIQDFVLSFGIEMEDMAGDNPRIPGEFDGDRAKFKEDDPTTWKYEGPLTGRTAQWEVGVKEYEGKLSNVPRMFIPAIPDLATKWPHVKTCKDMTKSSN